MNIALFVIIISMNSKLHQTICFLDIETTGVSLNRDKIIELAIIKTQNGVEIDRYEKLFNPKTQLNKFIVNLTGISQQELDDAEFFEDSATEIIRFLGDSLLVAHNARFDMGFLKTEFRKLGFDLKNQYCCSVKLSRILFPQYSKHNLDSIIERFNYSKGNRHRAMFDTEVIKNFYFDTLNMFDSEIHSQALKKAVSKPHIPDSISEIDLSNLPSSPGIYKFIGEKFPLYIGKSNDLKKRVLDHLYSSTISSKESKISQQIKKIETIPTVGVMGAEIRESILIKKEMPLYNQRLRRNSKMCIVKKELNKDGYFVIRIGREVETISHEEIENLIELAPSVQMTKFILDGISKKYSLCPALLGLEQHKGTCFSYHLGKCSGACNQSIDADVYNSIFEKAFENYSVMKWPFESAIVVKEENEDDIEEFLIYKWFLVGSTKGKIKTYEDNPRYFDRDIYKILKNHVLNSKKISIEPVDIQNTNLDKFMNIY